MFNDDFIKKMIEALNTVKEFGRVNDIKDNPVTKDNVIKAIKKVLRLKEKKNYKGPSGSSIKKRKVQTKNKEEKNKFKDENKVTERLYTLQRVIKYFKDKGVITEEAFKQIKNKINGHENI